MTRKHKTSVYMVTQINLFFHNNITNFHAVLAEIARNCTSTIMY